jgi:hypothetical protein
MAKEIDYNALGQAMDTTFGRSSTPKTASQSIKLTLIGTDRVAASYVAIVSFATERNMIELKRRYEEEAKAVTSAMIKYVKKAYKDLCDENVTFKEISNVDNLEIINFNVHNPRRTAYYRHKAVFEIS